jgi:hypothetical protein
MICRSRRVRVVCVDDFVICYFSSIPATKIASDLAAPKSRRRRVTTGNRRGPSNVSHVIGGGGMSLLKRLLGKNDPPKVRVRVCVECGMPLAEHKDWCAIYQQQLEREKLVASKA